ncbi:DNA polymerase delta subunit 4 [Benincasa hispida]|uniref:DNA polymerase delta subunit 4 n=1 Tax=Benincasa hispida TaxID=102211 RepID=UPI0018FFE5D7|nr:DNA polymerase delta subunit 4 [Benincasa hispida]
MASARGGLKDFYKQRKNSGISKANSKASKPSSRKIKSPANSASLGSDAVQPAALISHGSLDLQDDYGALENMLRQFDMNMAYGPCLGMTRMARWERACNLGLNPPKDIETLLKARKVQLECLWDSRV